MKELTDYSLLHHNTFGMDVRTAHFVEYESVEELCAFLNQKNYDLPLLHIGRGSNLLFSGDYQGTVLHSLIKGYEVVSETSDTVDVRVGAGEVWDDFVAYTVQKNLYGAVNLSLIPGEVGASAVQNIGAYGVEAKDLIVSVDTVCVSTGELRQFSNEECCYAYRKSIFKQELKGKYIVTHVTYRLSKVPVWHLDYGNIRTELDKASCPLTLDNLRRIIIRIREEKLPDPAQMGNAGSFFMNPVIPKKQFADLQSIYTDMPSYPAGKDCVKVPAGWMIDRCGWKGKSLGRAGVHARQALVLVNLGGATGKEIMALAEAVVASVKEKFGIDIHPEVNYI